MTNMNINRCEREWTCEEGKEFMARLLITLFLGFCIKGCLCVRAKGDSNTKKNYYFIFAPFYFFFIFSNKILLECGEILSSSFWFSLNFVCYLSLSLIQSTAGAFPFSSIEMEYCRPKQLSTRYKSIHKQASIRQ